MAMNAPDLEAVWKQRLKYLADFIYLFLGVTILRNPAKLMSSTLRSLSKVKWVMIKPHNIGLLFITANKYHTLLCLLDVIEK